MKNMIQLFVFHLLSPSRMLNGTAVYESRRISADYKMRGGAELVPIYLSPKFMYAHGIGNTLEFRFSADNITALLATSSLETSLDKIYKLIVGTWTCTQSNLYGNASAQLALSECGK